MRKFGRKLTSALLALALLASVLPLGAAPAQAAGEGDTETVGVFNVTGGQSGTDYTYTAPSEYETQGGDVLTIKSSTALTISTNNESEPTKGCRIVIESGVAANITLAGVNITPADAGTNDGYSGIDLASGATLNITLQSDSANVINGGTSQSGSPGPGIHVPEGSTLTIDGKGSLQVQGASHGGLAAVGIGGKVSASDAGGACGNVIILGGIITVQGGTPTSGGENSAVDIGGGAAGNGNGGDCNTVIILTSVNRNGNLEIGGGAGAGVGGNKGSDGASIRPTGDGNYTVYGDLTLPCGITIPDGATVTIPAGASLTVPEGVTLTNGGTILVQGGAFTNSGSVEGNQPTYPSTVTVSFSQGGKSVTAVPYGSTVTVTATMEKAETAANALEVDPGMVGFYLGEDIQYGILVGTDDVEIVDGVYTAAVDVTLDDEKGVTEVGTITITAVFGGYASEDDESGDSLAPNTGSAQLTVTKAEQTAPTGTFFTTSSTENSITVTFTDVSQTKNENGIEIAYAVGPTASEPSSNWTTATKSSSGSVYTAEIENLSPGTPYIFFARYKGDDTHEPSPAIASSSAFYTKPKITTQGLPNAYVGVEYSQKLVAEAAEGVAVSWTITSGSLPDGLTLNGDGTITGTPTTPTTQAANFTVNATIGEGASSIFTTQVLTISVTKSDAELGGLTVSGNTGLNNAFQYGDTITVTFNPERKADTSTNAQTLAEGTATLTYMPDEGESKQLATATAQADGSFKLTYDTKEKQLPIGEDLTLTVSYGGSNALNPTEGAVTVTLEPAPLKNAPTISGEFVSGKNLTANYTKQDDETVTYQWNRNGTAIANANDSTYTLTTEDIDQEISVTVTASDENHTGSKTSEAVTISAPELPYTGKFSYEISTSVGDHGAISVDRYATEGDKVTIAVSPDDAYKLDALSVTAKGKDVELTDNGDGTFSFTMPSGDVRITATFAEDPDWTEPEEPATDVSDIFVDIAPDAWYKDAVQYAYDNGLMTGVSANEFAPEATTTRAMIVSILARLEGVTSAESAGFADVSANDWYATAVNWAAAEGIVSGTGEGDFSPNAAITREQLAAMLMNYTAYKGEDVSARADLSAYTDQPSVWATETMQWAVAEGLISGVTNTQLQPQGNATRAQVAAILQRFLCK